MAKKTTTQRDIHKWWREARFGMFIHWGLYAVPAGIWKGKEIPGIGEWIMHRAQIPVKEYEKLTRRFNPTRFNADEWAQLAKDAGMKYLVITSKHHDGFSMFGSRTDTYNIVSATPYKKDPMKDLARACRRRGIRLCFYYSQDQDWHEPEATGNTWDWPKKTKRGFAEYLEAKVKPQLTELLTRYGPLGLIWFDTPYQITKAQSLDLKKFVHKLQPDCLVSGRVGNDVGDYGSMGDNQIPSGRVKGYWETPATVNDTWAFKKNDKNWKPTKTLLYLLVDLASKGVNYLLNVGPTAGGIIPAASVKRLREIGEWMQTNGEAIYGTEANPFPFELEWGRITQKPGKLYLFFYQWPSMKHGRPSMQHGRPSMQQGRPGRSFTLSGVKNSVKRAYLLADKRQSIHYEQTRSTKDKRYEINLSLPAQKPDRYVSVVVLEIEGKARVDSALVQQNSGNVCLPAHMASIQNPKSGCPIGLDPSGIVTGWTRKQGKLVWEFMLRNPGTYAVQLSTAALTRPRIWKGGHTVELKIAGKTFTKKLRKDEALDTPRTRYIPEMVTKLGRVSLKKPGLYKVEMKALEINRNVPGGLHLSEVRILHQPN